MWAKWGVVVKELKIVSYVAAPMVVVTVLQYLLQAVSVIMVGHLDDLSLSGVSIATSFTSATGFSLLVNSLFYPCFRSSVWSISRSQSPTLTRTHILYHP